MKIQLSLQDMDRLARIGALTDLEWDDLLQGLMRKGLTAEQILALHSARINARIAFLDVAPVSSYLQ